MRENNSNAYKHLRSILLNVHYLNNERISNKYIFTNLKLIDNLFSDYSPNNVVIQNKVIRAINKFYSLSNGNFEDNYWEYKEVRFLVKGLDQKIEGYETIIFSTKLKFAIRIIKEKWRDSMLPRLLHILLRNWNKFIYKYQLQYNLLVSLIDKKINGYSKSNGIVSFVKNNRNYFLRQNGVVEFAETLLMNAVDPLDTIFKLGLSTQYTNLEYFDEVLRIYLYNRKLIQIPDFEILDRIISTRFDQNIKRILCSVIINKSAKENKFKNQIQKLSIDKVGDPAISSYWLIEDENLKKFQGDVDKAKDTLNLWINSNIIELFFSSLSFYPERKNFWKNYVNVIPNIKLSGKIEVLNGLKMDKRISAFIDSRFIISNTGPTVLLFSVNDYLLVEYSVQGNAFYAYQKNTNEYGLFYKKRITNTYNFKRTSLPTLNLNINEGRLIHNNGEHFQWQSKLKKWLKYKVGL